MKTYSALALGVVMTASALYADAVVTKSHQSELLEQQAKAKVQLFARTLKAELQAAIQQGGLTEGIQVCKQRAPKIAAQLSTDGWQLGRTSLKLRNPDNLPDQWERKTLEDFASMLAKGVPPDKLLASTMQGDQFRMMKGIPTAGLCLSCHGQTLPVEVSKALRVYYPDDRATGFQAGELRGAFTVRKTLQPATR